jgi:hypothetical protein
MKYQEFLKQKQIYFESIGFEPDEINPKLFPFQKAIVRWALRKGRACLFEGTGCGKTIQQLEWCRQINKKENEPVLIVAPLAVSEQTKREGEKFGYTKQKLGIECKVITSDKDVINGINIINYEKLHKINSKRFIAVCLDECSILKNMAGVIRNKIIEAFFYTLYRLACSATPSPNDEMELGNHAEYLGVMTYTEMLSMFFVNDPSDVGQWRLKKHAKESDFWEWLCSWAVMFAHPKDIGFEQDGYDLPPLNYIEHIIPATNTGGGFFVQKAETLSERLRVRRETIKVRCEKAAEIVNSDNDQWIIWCGLNGESELLAKLINDGKEVTGSQSNETKAKYMLRFSEGKVKRLISKAGICGHGMNWQNCNKIIYVGLNDSFEQLFQSTRRVWRFGQKRPVEAHIVIEEREGKVLENVKRKDRMAQSMLRNMVKYTVDITRHNLGEKISGTKKYEAEERMVLPGWI